MRLFSLLSSILAICVLMQPVPVEAQPTAISADIGGGEVRGLVYHEPSDRIIVAAGDAVHIFDLQGRRTSTITDVRGALDPEASGEVVVVASPPTGELVVIDPVDGTVIRRIFTAAQAISSIEVVGDVIWFAHGPDQHNAGIGKASVAEGTTATFVMGPANTNFSYAGDLIEVSGAFPDRAYLSSPRSSPTGLDWVDEDDNRGYGPYHDSFLPFSVSDRGDYVWAFYHRHLVRFDAETLHVTDFFFEEPLVPSTDEERRQGLLANYDDERLALALGRTVTQYATSSTRVANSSSFPGLVTGVDLTDTSLIVAYESGTDSSALVVMPRSGEPVQPPLTILVRGFGSPNGAGRATITYRCGEVFGSFQALYGGTFDVDVPFGTTSCELSISGGPTPSDRYVETGSGRFRGDTYVVQITGGPQWIVLVDVHPSVFDDGAVLASQAFGDLLGRAPRDAEVAEWRTRFDEGTPPEVLVARLVESPDFLGQVAPTVRLYDAFFQRQPDDDGLAYWLDVLRQGVAHETVAEAFVVSAEFRMTYGDLDDESFIDLVYRNVLLRPADEAGRAYWESQLQASITRGQVMIAFAESPENVSRTSGAIAVRALYYGMLAREPDPLGAAYWRDLYDSGVPLDSLVGAFFASDEFAARFWITDNGQG